jgi:hypothetical protein
LTVFDPFVSPSSDFFGRTALTDSMLQDSEMASEVINRGVENAGYVTAAKRAAKYAEKAAKRGIPSPPSTGSQIAGSIAAGGASAVVGFGLSLI